MKKYMIYSLVILAFAFFACEDPQSLNRNDDIPNDNIVVDSGIGLNFDGLGTPKVWTLVGDVSISSISFFDGINSKFDQYRGTTEIWADSLHTISVNAGDVIIGGTGPLSAIPNSDSSYWVYETDDFSGFTPPYDLNFGSTQRWYIQGNSGAGISEVDVNLYIPKLFEITSGLNGEYGINNSVDRTQDWTITWDADTYNSNGKVALIFFYDRSSSRVSEIPNLPETIESYQILVDDTGSYTFPSSFLLNWPYGAFFDLTIGRGKYDIVEKPEGFYRFSTITITYARLIMD